MATTDKLYALHEVTLKEEDRELLREIRDLLKRFLVIEVELLELTRLGYMAVQGTRVEDGELEHSN